jgi:hypothetical protein
MERKKIAYGILVEKSEGRKPGRDFEDNIKIDFR